MLRNSMKPLIQLKKEKKEIFTVPVSPRNTENFYIQQQKQLQLPKIRLRSVQKQGSYIIKGQKKNFIKQRQNSSMYYLNQDLDMKQVRLSINPIRSLENNIKRKLSTFNEQNSKMPILLQNKQNVIKNSNFLLQSMCSNQKKLEIENNKIEIRLGKEKINMRLKIQFCSKISFNTQGQHEDVGYLYHLLASSGRISGKSSNLTFQRLTQSQISLRMNHKMLKKFIYLAFYKVTLPENLYQRKKIGYIILQLPFRQINNYSLDVPITIMTKLWGQNNQQIQDIKLYIKAQQKT